MADSRNIPMRYSEEALERIATVGEAMARRAGGVELNRAAVIRLALERGLTELEYDLGLRRRPRKRTT